MPGTCVESRSAAESRTNVRTKCAPRCKDERIACFDRARNRNANRASGGLRYCRLRVQATTAAWLQTAHEHELVRQRAVTATHAMPSINNIGGSLTSAVILTLLAWGVRVLRATAQRQGTNNQRRGSKSDLQASLVRFFAPLSPAALRMRVCAYSGPCAWLCGGCMPCAPACN